MSDLTRRAFVKNSAAATAGITVIGALLGEQADAHTSQPGSKAVVAYVRDPGTGDISVLSGDREVHIRDHKLAAVAATELGLRGGFWTAVSQLNINTLGYVIVGLFVGTWVIALLVWRLAGLEQRWRADLSWPGWGPR
jgi:hypothetical protein